MQQKRYNYSIKSPGIRPMSRASVTSTRAHTFPFSPFGYQKIEEDPESSSPQCTTPPTPTTPISPVSSGDNGVFGHMTSGQGNPACFMSVFGVCDLISFTKYLKCFEMTSVTGLVFSVFDKRLKMIVCFV